VKVEEGVKERIHDTHDIAESNSTWNWGQKQSVMIWNVLKKHLVAMGI